MSVVSRARVLMTMLVVAGLVSACAARSGGRGNSGQSVVVLLADPEDSHVGRIGVTSPKGSTELTSARASARVSLTRAPRIRTLSEAGVHRQFGQILATLPPPPRHFTLPFRFDSEELTDGGKQLLPDVLRSVKSYPAPEVVVIGHTDTTGTPQSNAELGLRRANAVRALLVQAGLSPSAIDVRSHGEGELLVPTADNVFEPKNRRVEVTVR
jgi:outer membrane protein OmpA-like peptidoglycan-associated protein